MITVIAGTRPNFMKVAPILRELEKRGVAARLVHTGQHFDATMSDVFFRDLEMRAPDRMLKTSGSTHGEQTASILVEVEKELIASRPSVLVVVGDVTSTLSAALAASKLQIPVVHVEAGLRSRDFTMPEEINRILTDQISDLLLLPSHDAKPNLLAEGIAEERIVFVGNVMIDSLKRAVSRPTDVLTRLGLAERGYALLTLHRPANVDSADDLDRTFETVESLVARLPTVFPIHPRTRARLASLGKLALWESKTNLRLVDPFGYRDFSTLMGSARVVVTDSGGIQEETTALSIPCLTLREGTERPITVEVGTNTIVGRDRKKLELELDRILVGNPKKGNIPDGWDGNTASRIVDAIESFLAGSPPPKTSGPRA